MSKVDFVNNSSVKRHTIFIRNTHFSGSDYDYLCVSFTLFHRKNTSLEFNEIYNSLPEYQGGMFPFKSIQASGGILHVNGVGTSATIKSFEPVVGVGKGNGSTSLCVYYKGAPYDSVLDLSSTSITITDLVEDLVKR